MWSATRKWYQTVKNWNAAADIAWQMGSSRRVMAMVDSARVPWWHTPTWYAIACVCSQSTPCRMLLDHKVAMVHHTIVKVVGIDLAGHLQL